MKNIFVIHCLILSSTYYLKAQHLGVAADIGYSYKFLNRSAHQLYLGGAISYHKESDRRNRYFERASFYTLNLGAYYAKYGNKYKWVPALAIAKSFDRGTLLPKIQLTPYSVTPSLGLNFWNFLHLGLGYNIGYKKLDGFNMSGVVLSLNINIGSASYYHREPFTD